MTGHTYEILLSAAVVLPFISFWVLVFKGPQLGKPRAGWLAVILGMGLPCVLAAVVLVGWGLFEDPASRASLGEHALRFHWADIGRVAATIGVKLDSLTVAMFFMVTFVALCIFVFSVGYMAGHSDEVDHQSKYWRFFAYLSLFGFSMLGLVISSSLLFLFIFWELVGLCSYLLIGYYFDRDYASRAAIKAFITNRVGDFGFIIGLSLVYVFFGTLDLEEAAAAFAHQYAAGTGLFAETVNLLGFSVSGMTLATIMGVCLFCGAMGKSAQFPLHVWLPDAMAGPTPVSALIHAATMVAAGVYLVARIFRLLTPDAQMFIAVIGCITLSAMALIAIVQTDIKKCLAYSTLSQLGYMIFGLGVGAWIAALFHLITHAFFKAMLFLGSGQVIEGCHHEQDMRKMGGLRHKMPVTCWTFFVGVLAIAGAGIPGLHFGDFKLGLGGFFSKDEILAVAYDRTYNWDRFSEDGLHAAGNHESVAHESDQNGEYPGKAVEEMYGITPSYLPPFGPASDKVEDAPGAGEQAGAHGGEHGASPKAAVAAGVRKLPKWMFWLAIITAYITPFYMFRCWWLTFMGKPRDHHVHEHAHESPLMYRPLVVLAVGTVVASYFIFRPMIAGTAAHATDAALVVAVDGEASLPADTLVSLDHAPGRDPHAALAVIVGFAFVVGFFLAWLVYRGGLELPERLRRIPPVRYVHLLLEKKYFFDEVYNFVWVGGCLVVARISRFVDTYVVDALCNLSAVVVERLAALAGRVLDPGGVDGFIHAVVESANDLASALRRPQSGRIRGYLVLMVGAATLVLGGILVYPGLADLLGVNRTDTETSVKTGTPAELVYVLIGAVVILGVVAIQVMTAKAESLLKRRGPAAAGP